MKRILMIYMQALVLLFMANTQYCWGVASSHIVHRVSSWVYVLQDGKIDDIIAMHPDIAVMDYSYDGTEEGVYSPEDLQRLKNAGIVPIVYISIGEAEDYRWYWEDSWYREPPPWLGRENPSWQGNYAVKFWYPQWQRIIFQYLDRVIAQGFEGVYLDKVDIYEYWADEDNGEGFYLREEETASLMIDFVEKISRYARSRKQSFYVFIQNAEDIVRYKNGAILSAIDGIGVESLFYDGTTPQPDSATGHRLFYLSRFHSSGKLVLVVEYADDGSGFAGDNASRVEDAIRKNLYHGFIPYIARYDESLSGVNPIFPIQPFISYSGCAMCYLLYR